MLTYFSAGLVLLSIHSKVCCILFSNKFIVFQNYFDDIFICLTSVSLFISFYCPCHPILFYLCDIWISFVEASSSYILQRILLHSFLNMLSGLPNKDRFHRNVLYLLFWAIVFLCSQCWFFFFLLLIFKWKGKVSVRFTHRQGV